MTRKGRLTVSKDLLRQFCKKYGIRKLSLFGSILRGDFKPTSDIDVLVEFEQGQRVGLLRIARIENELSDILGRKVDLRTPQELSRYFRQEVIDSSEVQYAKG
jgi:uncharacterized protein